MVLKKVCYRQNICGRRTDFRGKKHIAVLICSSIEYKTSPAGPKTLIKRRTSESGRIRFRAIDHVTRIFDIVVKILSWLFGDSASTFLRKLDLFDRRNALHTESRNLFRSCLQPSSAPEFQSFFRFFSSISEKFMEYEI